MKNLTTQIDAILPQTQCTQCGYPDCKAYAKAIAVGELHNQCPPGGDKVIADLAKLLGRDIMPLNPQNGIHKPKERAVIREDECIGCVKCAKVCPVDAIIGTGKMMHTVLAHDCTGCELCVPACPVDCIDMVVAKDSTYYSDDWREAHQHREARLLKQEQQEKVQYQAKVADTQSILAQALARAKAKK